MAEYVTDQSHHDPALNELAYCTTCKAVFLNIVAANDHEVSCGVEE